MRECNPDANKRSYDDVAQYLREHGKTVDFDAESGLAALDIRDINETDPQLRDDLLAFLHALEDDNPDAAAEIARENVALTLDATDGRGERDE